MFIQKALAVEDTQAQIGVPGSEAAGGGTYLAPFDPTTIAPQLIWLALTFGVLYLIMSKIALPRISDILEVRHDRIRGDLAEAERLRQQTDRAIASYEEALATARQNAHNIAQETRDKLQTNINTQKAKVEAELAEKIAAAEVQIAHAQRDALSHIDEIASDTAKTIVTELVGHVADADYQDAVRTSLKGANHE